LEKLFGHRICNVWGEPKKKSGTRISRERSADIPPLARKPERIATNAEGARDFDYLDVASTVGVYVLKILFILENFS